MSLVAAVDPGALLGALSALAARSALLLLLGWLGASLLRRTPPQVRQALWAAVVAGVLVLPLLTGVLPAWSVLPEWPALAGAARAPFGGDERALPGGPSTPLPAPALENVEEGGHAGASLDWRLVAVVLWAGGSLAVALVVALGLLRLRRIGGGAAPAPAAARAEAERLARELGVRRPLRVVAAAELASPATWGVLRPVVALPEAAARWSAERLRLVLAHEVAHVARHDFAWRLAAQLGCVAYWFNPLVWLAARRLRLEQEMACDLAVLAGGARPSTYADHLLSIARAAAGRPLPRVALDMARRSQMEGRLMSILSNRSEATARRLFLLPALVVLLSLPLLAAAAPQSKNDAEPAANPLLVGPAALAAPAIGAPALPAAAPSPARAPRSISATSAPPREPAPEPPAPAAPAPRADVEPAVAPAVEADAAPALAPAPKADVEPVAAPAPQVDVEPAVAPAVAPAPVSVARWPEGELDEETMRVEEEIARRAEEIAKLMEPIHQEIERTMEERMQPILERMELVQLEMEPIHEEMSRIGEQMGEEMGEEIELEVELETEELERVAQQLAHEAWEHARLGASLAGASAAERERIEAARREVEARLSPLREEMEVLRTRIAERHRVSADEIRARMEPHRERMEALRERLRPERERMEELRAELEPVRRELEALRETRMAEIRERLGELRTELEQLREERLDRRRDGEPR